MTCVEYEGVTVCRPGETRVYRTEDVGDKWCFVCRKRRAFTFTLTGEVGPSYYDPWPAIKCSHGHQDGDLFPGRIREWDES